MIKELTWKFGGFVILAALIALPFTTNPYAQYIVNLALVNVVITIGLNILLGYAGQFAFAHAALMGIGAYTTALLGYWLNLSFWIALPVSGVVAMLIGSLGAFPAMRIKSVYLALVTLAFAEFTVWVLTHWKTLTLGTDGVSVEPPSLFGHLVAGDTNVYYVLLAITTVLYLAARLIVTSRLGRAMVAVRENEIVAQCSGIDVPRTKALAFAISAFYAGIGGAMFALTLGFIVPDGFGTPQVVIQFSMVAIGGFASLFGSIIGAVVLTGLPEMLRDFQALQEIIYGVMLVVFVLLMPKGIAGLAKRVGLLPEELLVRAGALKSLRRNSSATAKPGSSKPAPSKSAGSKPATTKSTTSPSVASKAAVQGETP